MGAADRLTDRLDALAVALRDAGVPPERASTILGSAATATMQALLLDAVLEENADASKPAVQDTSQPVDAPLRVAA